MMKQSLAISAVLASFSGLVSAMEGPYLTFGGGWSNLRGAQIEEVDDSTIAATTVSYKKDDPNVWHAALGTFVDDSMGVELGFTGFARKKTEATGAATAEVEQSTRAYAAELVAVGRTHFNDAFSGFLKLGVGYGDIERKFILLDDVGGTAVLVDDKDHSRGAGVAGGVGVQYDMTEVLGFRGEVSGLTGKASHSLVTGQVVLNFG